MRLIQGMYANAWSWVRVFEGYSEEFEVKVGVHQGFTGVLLWGPLGRTSMQMTLLSSLNPSRNVSGEAGLGKKQWRRKGCE